MLRSFSLSVMVILMLSSSVFADIGQAEGFSISALNKVQRVGGAGWAESGNLVFVDHGQRTYVKGTVAIQKEAGIVFQGARVAGLGGTTKILQGASVNADQQQSVTTSRHGYLEQGQNLTVSLDSVIRQTSGIGTAVSAQGFIGDQKQIMITPNGSGVNYQAVGAAQFASVSAGPCSNVVIVNTIDVDMGQGQAVTGSVAPPRP